MVGVVLCLYTLTYMWTYRVLVMVLLERMPLVNLLGGRIPMWILFALIATIATIGGAKVIRLLWMLRRAETVEDAPVQLRIALYVMLGWLCYCVFILSTPEAFSGPFRLRFPILAWVTASIAYGIWCVLPRLRYRFASRTRRWFDVVAFNVTLTIISAEIALRVAASFWANPILMTDSTTSSIQRNADRMQPGALRFGFPINSGGHYDTEFLPAEKRSKPLVVNIGDSFSYGVVPHYYHYTTVAEREFPGAEIYNIGFPGTDPADYLHQLVEVALPLEPDLVVIAIFVGNDITTNMPTKPATHICDAQSYMVGIVWHRLQILRRAWGNNWTQDPPDTNDEELTSRYPWLTDPSQEQPSLGKDMFLELESRNAFTGAADLPGLYTPFFAVLQDIEDAAGDVPLVFLIIPDEYQVEDELWKAVVAKNDVPLERDRPQRKIREWARNANRDVVDLLPLFREVEPLRDGQRHLYHLRDMHFNARGNQIAGQALARLIKSKLAESHAEFEAAKLPLLVKFGTPASRRWMDSGWSRDEPGLVWSDGPQSTLKIPLSSESDARMQIKCLPFEYPGAPQQRIDVWVNNKSIKTLVIKPGQTDYTVVLPSDLLRNGVDRLEFKYAYTRNPKDVIADSVDARSLAVAWLSIEFSKTSSEEVAP